MSRAGSSSCARNRKLHAAEVLALRSAATLPARASAFLQPRCNGAAARPRAARALQWRCPHLEAGGALVRSNALVAEHEPRLLLVNLSHLRTARTSQAAADQPGGEGAAAQAGQEEQQRRWQEPHRRPRTAPRHHLSHTCCCVPPSGSCRRNTEEAGFPRLHVYPTFSPPNPPPPSRPDHLPPPPPPPPTPSYLEGHHAAQQLLEGGHALAQLAAGAEAADVLHLDDDAAAVGAHHLARHRHVVLGELPQALPGHLGRAKERERRWVRCRRRRQATWGQQIVPSQARRRRSTSTPALRCPAILPCCCAVLPSGGSTLSWKTNRHM